MHYLTRPPCPRRNAGLIHGEGTGLLGMYFTKRMVGFASDLREVAGELVRSQGDGEHCSKFHFDKVMNGTSCGAEQQRTLRFHLSLGA
jgi:hypothetical protein